MWFIDRALAREIAGLFAAAVVVLTLVLVSSRLVRLLAAAAEGDLPRAVLLPLLGYQMLALLAVLVPAALFFAVLAACGRWYRDHEMVILAMAGIGPLRLLAPILGVGLPVAALTAWLALWAGPDAQREVQRVRAEAEQALRVAFFRPGEFRSFDDGAQVFYARSVGANGALKDVYVQLGEGKRAARIVAGSAQQRTEPETGDAFLVLRDGRRYEGEPGQGGFRISGFEEYGVRVERPQPPTRAGAREARTSAALWAADTPTDRAELQWRLSQPLAALLLAALALPLSRTAPRAGRGGQLVLALLVYLLYNNLLSMSQSWTALGLLPPWVGLWWVHAVGLLAIVASYGAPQLRQWRSGR